MRSDPLLVAGLVLSLLGLPMVLGAFRLLKRDTVDPGPRMALWLVAALASWWVAGGSTRGLRLLSPTAPGPGTLGWSLGGTVAVLILWAPLQWLRRRLGAGPLEETEAFRKLAGRSFPYRVFLVVTAGVVEEVLYRGVAIGAGSALLGGVWPAAAVSLVVFTGAHWAWDRAHLLSVFAAGTVLTLLFVLGGDLLACVLAHTLVDSVGLLLAPAMMARRSGTQSAPP